MPTIKTVTNQHIDWANMTVVVNAKCDLTFDDDGRLLAISPNEPCHEVYPLPYANREEMLQAAEAALAEPLLTLHCSVCNCLLDPADAVYYDTGTLADPKAVLYYCKPCHNAAVAKAAKTGETLMILPENVLERQTANAMRIDQQIKQIMHEQNITIDEFREQYTIQIKKGDPYGDNTTIIALSEPEIIERRARRHFDLVMRELESLRDCYRPAIRDICDQFIEELQAEELP